MLNYNHALLSVGYDVESLRDLTPESASVAEVPQHIIILLHRDENGMVHQKRLNQASAAAILMIGGAPTFRAFVAAYSEWLGRASSRGLEEELKDLCLSLCGCGALAFEPAVAGDAARTGQAA